MGLEISPSTSAGLEFLLSMRAATTHSKLCDGVYCMEEVRGWGREELSFGGGVPRVRLHLVHLALGKEDARVSVKHVGWGCGGRGELCLLAITRHTGQAGRG